MCSTGATWSRSSTRPDRLCAIVPSAIHKNTPKQAFTRAGAIIPNRRWLPSCLYLKGSEETSNQPHGLTRLRAHMNQSGGGIWQGIAVGSLVLAACQWSWLLLCLGLNVKSDPQAHKDFKGIRESKVLRVNRDWKAHKGPPGRPHVLLPEKRLSPTHPMRP